MSLKSLFTPACAECLATNETIQLIQLHSQYICANCLGHLNNAVNGDLEEWKRNGGKIDRASKVKPLKTITPPKVKEYLDKHIIGQDHAKKVLSVAVYNHTKRLRLMAEGQDPIDKSNILMVGPTGSGKTLIVKTIAKLLDVPFVMSDATGLVQAGYVGRSIEECIQTLHREASFDRDKAEMGIVFIDEIDKLARKGSMPTGGRDVSGEGVQQGLLKLLEGTDVIFNMMLDGRPQTISINTENILFICGGAFVSETPIVSTQDVINFGMIPEFVGRLPVLTLLEGHTEESLLRILHEPKNSIIDQAIRLFRADGVTLQFTDMALRLIVRHAIQSGTGARGLKTIVDKILLEEQFNIGNISKIVVNEKLVQQRLR